MEITLDAALQGWALAKPALDELYKFKGLGGKFCCGGTTRPAWYTEVGYAITGAAMQDGDELVIDPFGGRFIDDAGVRRPAKRQRTVATQTSTSTATTT